MLEIVTEIVGKLVRFLDSHKNRTRHMLKCNDFNKPLLLSTGTFVIVYIP